MDWLKLNHALTMCKTYGFQQIEVPWIVNPEINRATSVRGVVAGDGELIGSGEQGLLAIRETLKPGGRYCCLTPCFRIEENYEPGFRQPWFAKVEMMFVLEGEGEFEKTTLIQVAKRIMGTWTKEIVFKDDDLMLNSHEVGSYGVREFQGFRWAFGTALAEPRFTSALRK